MFILSVKCTARLQLDLSLKEFESLNFGKFEVEQVVKGFMK